MKAARLRGIRDVEIDEIPVPEPGPGEARVRVTRVGMCGSDVHYYAHMRIGYAVCEPGHIPGHEAAGVIEKLGPDIEDDR
ncbi:MAG: alcohol dehydrogenase catalytic domain-containing protein, partial [Planctomycetota bacterium]